MIKQHIKTILTEINHVLKDIEDYQVDLLTDEILSAKAIVIVGAGRVGMAGRGFSMRLGHLGFNAYAIGDSTVPKVKKGDLVVVCSGSGETQTIYDMAEIAKKNGARLALISSYIEHRKSRMAKIADTVLVINAPNKAAKIKGFSSVQPMTTLNEQCLTIFFDAFVLILMKKLKETHNTMWERHSVLE
jgi:6-phospho-3-hexuloisomerase